MQLSRILFVERKLDIQRIKQMSKFTQIISDSSEIRNQGTCLECSILFYTNLDCFSILILKLHPIEIVTHTYKETCTKKFLISLLIVKNWKQTKYSSVWNCKNSLHAKYLNNGILCISY